MSVDLSCEDENQLHKLEYSVYRFSSYAPSYFPANIQEDKAFDQSSRWSSETNNPPQFLVLKLSKYAIIRTITFGKYEKTHVCNLKKFKVFGGLEEDNMLELLDGGLKNDSKPETFMLRYTVGGKPFASRYIKIAPIQSWGPSFNFTIWFVELMGVDCWKDVKPAIDWFTNYRKREAVRLCLKYLRQMNYHESFKVLQQQSAVDLEDKKLNDLCRIVQRGDYEQVEDFMRNAINDGLLSSYVSKLDYRPTWQCIFSDRPRPGMRGGHQMCLDPYAETIYLLGGWDGHQDLSDLWSYHIPSNKWTLISSDTEAEGGPSARSCHKVCLDPERRQIFTLGRYLDTQCRTPESLKSDFYVYNIDSNTWTQITDDTSTKGGPKLIFDHQMCMDVALRTIYVFGGRVLAHQPNPNEDRNNLVQGLFEPRYSGLFSYQVSTNTWKQICSDNTSDPNLPILTARVGHSMLFHPVNRKLYIFAGQRLKDYLNDFFSYEVDSGRIEYLCEGSRNKDNNNLPAAGFTQRATIDPELDEIYVLSGLSKDKEKRDDNVQNSFWVFYIRQNKWSCVYKNENTGSIYWSKMQGLEPIPRFAHQLVYDHLCKVHYLFGGNPGVPCQPKLRLDDFWKLQLSRPSNPQLLQQCQLLIRKYKFHELAVTDRVAALLYVQNSLYELIDHNDPEDVEQFHNLGVEMISHQDKIALPYEKKQEYLLLHRTKLFDELSAFFPEFMTQPTANLADIVPL